MTTDYRKRVKLPPQCTAEDERLEFRTRTGLVIARGYVRVEFGGRGPYIEFAPSQIVQAAIHRIEAKWIQYTEYRSNDSSNVKLYFQLEPVTYAHYVPGLWYISPFDLVTDKYPELVKPESPAGCYRVSSTSNRMSAAQRAQRHRLALVVDLDTADSTEAKTSNSSSW